MFSGAACWQAWLGSQEQYTHKNMLNPLRNFKQQLQFAVIWPRQLFPSLLFLLFIKDLAADQRSRSYTSVPSFLKHNIFERKIKTKLSKGNYQ
jgi:hypothetical protein